MNKRKRSLSVIKTVGALLILPLLMYSCKTSNPKLPQPPLFPKSVVEETYHGKTIQDPYRGLESLKDSSVIKWFKEQNIYAEKILSLSKGKKRVVPKLKGDNKKSHPSVQKLSITSNDFYFYFKKNVGKDSKNDQLYYRKGLKGKEVFLYDFSTYKEGYRVNYMNPSHDGSKVAVAMAKNDGEIGKLIILDVSSKKLHKDVLSNCWPSELSGVSWLSDNKSFIYTYLPDVDKNSKKYLLNTASVIHTIGGIPKKRNVVLSKKNNPDLNITAADITMIDIDDYSNQKYLFGVLGGPTAYSDCYYVDNYTGASGIKWKPLFKKEDKVKNTAVYKDDLYFISAKNASNFRLCRTSLLKPDFNSPEVLVAEDPEAVISDLALTKDGAYYVKVKNGVEAKLFIYDFKDKTSQNIKMPRPEGKIYLRTHGGQFKNIWLKTYGWTNKGEFYKYYRDENRFVKEEVYPSNSQTSLNNLIVKEVEVLSHDGVKVPLSIIYKEGIKKDGLNRILLKGFGAYAHSTVPYPRSFMLAWINKGGVYAVAHVRGGGEKGDKWYEGGLKKTKPNTWKDFIACAKYLVNEKYTQPNKIAAFGISAGGICVGRAITEEPSLFSAAIIKVGTLNPLRLHETPNGPNNVKEFGDINKPSEFQALLEMDTYHNVKKDVNYPAVYLTAGMNDARVMPWIPGKLAAKMQALNTSDKPIILSVDFQGGHGLHASSEKRNQELANMLSFALWQTGHPDYQIAE